LKLDNGNVSLYTKKDFETGNAFGLQKKAFVADIDFIEPNFVSILTKNEAKWLPFTEIEDIHGRPTLLF
jgi:hypothetical protein